MDFNLTLSPQLPLWFVIIILGISIIPVLWAIYKQLRGSLFRGVAWAILTLAILNPSLLSEDRENLTNIVAIVTDQSGSQQLAERHEHSQSINKALINRIGQLDNFEIREIRALDQISATTDVSTALFKALQTGVKDVSGERLAGAILITDGQVHDIPEKLDELGINAPIHALITGSDDEKDRRIIIEEAPRYGAVGESFEISYKVLEHGFGDIENIDVSIYLDGELVSVENVEPNESYSYISEVSHAGKNIIEFRVETHPDELTATNNRVFATLNGIRENLRVLLVSGEPHAGERTWRNLLKSDASVDLVHFTILRPPEKQDGTPINQLSLIAFPTRELFIEKIDEFDLIIFDRYSRRGVLPILYFGNIARYVNDGGALLIASGPEYASGGSVATTPLNTVLPAIPNGLVTEKPFKPAISKIGNRHPVTRNLTGASSQKDWSRWFRSIGVVEADGEVVMEASDNTPLLVLKRYDEGRVALLLSDHAWLWARGFEGGGPHVQLLRRMAHWLMKEPELEEERLTAQSTLSGLEITRQSLSEPSSEIVITTPTGESQSIELSNTDDGLYSALLKNPEIGLHHITNGELSTLVHVGAPNPREFAEILSTTESLEPTLSQTTGAVMRVLADASDLPRILPIRAGAQASGNGWIGLQNSGATVLKGINRLAIFAGILGLTLLLLSFAALWAREGR